jgi:hypothetical protein
VKRYGFGAVNFMAGQLTYQIGERKNSEGFCALVKQTVQDYCPDQDYAGPKIGLVVDNYIIIISLSPFSSSSKPLKSSYRLSMNGQQRSSL